jgi:tRNA (cytidine/uridine-2'-O-)-methyltransferase
MNIILHEPEIPQNTGNIGRTCVATNTKLHLIRPIAFDTSEKAVRRSGLDYWQYLDVFYYDTFADFVSKNNNPHIFMIETKGTKYYTEVKYPLESFIMFGKETKGIPDEILEKYTESCIRIPMTPDNRSLNLSNSVAIVLYEALRQNGFLGLI